jgi:hypothetical protein
LDAVIDQTSNSNKRFANGWDRRSKHLLETARQAFNDGDAERGWRCLKAADRFMLYGLDPDQLAIEARPI